MEPPFAHVCIMAFNTVTVALAAVASGTEQAEAAVHVHSLFRALPELLLGVPPGRLRPSKYTCRARGDLQLASVLRSRLDLPKLGDWLGLAKAALTDKTEAACVAHPRPATQRLMAE